MAREFEIRKEVAFDATPEQVWEAIATGPGLTSWFMTHEVEPGEGGTVRLSAGGFTAESTITAWDPPNRLAVRGPDGPDGTFQAFEYLVEAREGGSTVLRFVHNGFVSDDWAAEYEDQSGHGWDMYFHTLGQYLRHFTGRAATYVTAEGPRTPDPDGAWPVLKRGLGLTGDPAEGDRVRLTPDGLAPLEGVADYVRPGFFLGVRTDDGLYRFHVRPDSVAVGHHIFSDDIFSDDVDQKESGRAWQSWLDRAFA
jgi:uncharacterized protein YndB with AHSA1/START domain